MQVVFKAGFTVTIPCTFSIQNCVDFHPKSSIMGSFKQTSLSTTVRTWKPNSLSGPEDRASRLFSVTLLGEREDYLLNEIKRQRLPLSQSSM